MCLQGKAAHSAPNPEKKKGFTSSFFVHHTTLRTNGLVFNPKNK